MTSATTNGPSQWWTWLPSTTRDRPTWWTAWRPFSDSNMSQTTVWQQDWPDNKLPEEIRATLAREKFETCEDLAGKARECKPAGIDLCGDERGRDGHGLRETQTRIQQIRSKFQIPSGRSLCLPRILQQGHKMQTSLQQGGKRHSRPSIAFIVAGSLTFHEATSNRSFLLDTGAEVSMLHANTAERLKQPMLRELLATNGSTIKCYGERTLHIHVSTCKYLWKLLVAAVKRALLGTNL